MAHTVLVVDDDVDFQTQMRIQLEAADYKVLLAETATAARELLGRRKPDIVVVDLMLEQPDAGFTLCYQIKRDHPDLPVIMVTAVATATGLSFDAETDEERAWIKADGLLAKPVRFEQLQREIQRLLKDE
ncbi:MAG: response regulator [Phycisphaerae bacterium]|jgi:CheY-like chemotaxis protein